MLSDAIAAALPELRAEAEANMTSTCTITRASGERVWDEATGTYSDAPRQVVYPPADQVGLRGRCKVQDTGRATGGVEAGERNVSITDQELHLPVEGSGDVRKGDVVRIDSSPLDQSLVGREYVVQAPHAATMKTARRLPVQAVV